MTRHLIHAIVRATAAAVIVAAGVVGLASTPASAAGCHYRIVWNVAGVYNSPQQQDKYLIKTKRRGDVVGEQCGYTINDGYYWNLVDVAGGVGWMRADAMVRV